jgi:hypothetical protein
MNKKIPIIKQLIENIDINKISYPLIKSNARTLYKLYLELKANWELIDCNQIKIFPDSPEYKKILHIVTNSLLSEYLFVNTELEKLSDNCVVKISHNNISFYYLNLGKYEQDIEHITQLFNQAYCLAKYSNITQEVVIIWVPINSSRDWNFQTINSDTLKKSFDNFTAFTASGVTFGTSPRITIISRYESVDKLMLHELIHNYNLDGSNHHEHNHKLISDYKKIKNPETKVLIENYDYPYSIYESWTELYSGYLRMCFRNIMLSDEKEIINRFITEILVELLYSYNTICNLIKINNYSSFKDFSVNKKFFGEICTYEYYYLKGLLYNNLKLCIPKTKKQFEQVYRQIISIEKDDPLLENVFLHSVEQRNFNYVFYE